jgi:hypothetical protein
MHRDRDLGGIDFPRIGGGFAAISSRILVVHFDRYDRCIEIAISGASTPPRIGGGFAAISTRVLGAAFDYYDRCIEIAISGASASPRIGCGFAAISSRVLVVHSIPTTDA